MYNFTNHDITVIPESYSDPVVIVGPGEMYKGRIDGVKLEDETLIKVNDFSDLVIANIDGKGTAFTLGVFNEAGDFAKERFSKDDLFSGVYRPESKQYKTLYKKWESRFDKSATNSQKIREITIADQIALGTVVRRKLVERD